MGLSSLRRYDVQARYASVLSLSALLPTIGALVLIFRNYHHEVRQIIYGSGSYVAVLLGCLAVSIALGGLGCLLGWNSAGQRRNDRSGLSWIGFSVGAASLTLDAILLLAFYMLRLSQ